MQNMQEKSKQVAAFLKGIASSHRLMILCELIEGEKSVSELIEATNIAQTSMSQHLSKLKKKESLPFAVITERYFIQFAMMPPTTLWRFYTPISVRRINHDCKKHYPKRGL